MTNWYLVFYLKKKKTSVLLPRGVSEYIDEEKGALTNQKRLAIVTNKDLLKVERLRLFVAK